MDRSELAVIVYVATLCFALVAYIVWETAKHAQARMQRERWADESHQATTKQLVEQVAEMAKGEARRQQQVVWELLSALTEPINAPAPPTPVHEQELAGQAADAIREFHDGFSGDPVDTPDWTDGWLPDTRGDEPRIASVRPGDSVVPGQGNWNAMMGEGRAVVGDEMVSGEDQWEGERYDG